MKYCTDCGETINDNEQDFCSNCGHAIEKQEAPVEAPIPDTVETANTEAVPTPNLVA